MSGVERGGRRPRTAARARHASRCSSIVLVLEAIVLFFAGLAVVRAQGARARLPAWVALPAAAVLIVVLLATTAVLRYRWGIALGWVLQVVLIALGILVPPSCTSSASSSPLLWIYCFIARPSHRRARAADSTPKERPP